MDKPKALIVNLFGAPGTGKSTLAAYLFARLKMAGVDAELVTEFAKDKTWENNSMVLSNQFYVFGKQNFRLARVANQVDVVVTDSPLPLSNYYAGDDPLMDNFKKACMDVFYTYRNVNYFLKRKKKYNPNGRRQTEAEADAIAQKIKNMMDDEDLVYDVIEADEAGYDYVVEDVLKILKEEEGRKEL